MKMHAWKCVVTGSEAEGSTMPRGRRQFTLRWLMGVVAVVGFEAFLYTSIAKRNAMVNPNASLRENLVQFLMGSLIYGVLFSRIRPAISTASNPGDPVSDSGGANA